MKAIQEQLYAKFNAKVLLMGGRRKQNLLLVYKLQPY
jgi:hypothetical protein